MFSKFLTILFFYNIIISCSKICWKFIKFHYSTIAMSLWRFVNIKNAKVMSHDKSCFNIVLKIFKFLLFVAYLIRIKASLSFKQKRNQKSFQKYGIWKPVHEFCWCLKYFKKMKSAWSLCFNSYFWAESLIIQNTETYVVCPLEYNTVTFLHYHVTSWECCRIDIGFAWAFSFLIKVTMHL